MYITKTLACPKLDETDCLKIVKINEGEQTLLYSTLCELMWQDDYDLSDDEILGHLCVKKGLFSYLDWQNLICDYIRKVGEIDYKVDSTKHRLNLEETIYQLGGFSGKVNLGGYKMLSSLCVRHLVFDNMEKFVEIFGSEPRVYIIEVWTELEKMLNSGVIVGKYTHELHDVKFHRQK